VGGGRLWNNMASMNNVQLTVITGEPLEIWFGNVSPFNRKISMPKKSKILLHFVGNATYM
jgi:hypothetical protein